MGAVLLLLAGGLLRAKAGECPGSFQLKGHGKVVLTNAGSNVPGESVGLTDLVDTDTVIAHMKARVYFSDECIEGSYSNTRYSAIKLLGKTLKYTTDVSGAGCGCNAALYLVSMQQNPQVSSCNDYYCDANAVCGINCAEVDIQEASKRAWHSTLHGSHDGSGLGGGYGGGDNWNGPRDFTSQQYAPGASCIDTSQPIDVAVSFPTDPQGNLKAMEITLTQKGKNCPLTINVQNYDQMSEITAALGAGMTPVISYWKSGDMLWMDGKGADQQGPCASDAQRCADSVKFYGFSLEDLPGQGPPTPEPTPAPTPPPTLPPTMLPTLPPLTLPPSVPVVIPVTAAPAPAPIPVPTPPNTPVPVEYVPVQQPTTTRAPVTAPPDLSLCSGFDEDCRVTHCCKEAGYQCYDKNQWWASCRETCTPGIDPNDLPQNQQPWSCKPLGPRTPVEPAREPHHDEIVLRIRDMDLPPNYQDGMEVSLQFAGQKVRAHLVKVHKDVETHGSVTAGSPGNSSGSSGGSDIVWTLATVVVAALALASVLAWAWRSQGGGQWQGGQGNADAWPGIGQGNASGEGAPQRLLQASRDAFGSAVSWVQSRAGNGDVPQQQQPSLRPPHRPMQRVEQSRAGLMW